MQPPPVISRSSSRWAWWLGGILVLMMAGVVLFQFNPACYSFYPRCMLYATTGIYCPGCGSQRALYQLLHGHLFAALRCNALLTLSLPFAACIGVRYSILWATHKPLPALVVRPAWMITLIGAVVLFTVLRNIPCVPFIYLSPT